MSRAQKQLGPGHSWWVAEADFESNLATSKASDLNLCVPQPFLQEHAGQRVRAPAIKPRSVTDVLLTLGSSFRSVLSYKMGSSAMPVSWEAQLKLWKIKGNK